MTEVRTFGGELKPPLDENLLEHHGVKGMHWGVRRSETTGFRARTEPAPGVHPKTDKSARKDAEEFARAKMFYGQGAGTRRKLIKAKVESNKKNMPGYSKAFDHHLTRQDMSSHAAKAQSERARKNTTSTTMKTGKAFARHITGQQATAAAIIALTAAGAVWLRSDQADRVIAQNIFGASPRRR